VSSVSSSTGSTSASSASSVTTTGTTTSTSLDWNKLVEVAVNAKLAQATSITTTLTSNQAKITAYQGLQSDLGTLSTSLRSLATAVVNSLATNVFATRTATISSTGDVSASSALSMTVGNGAALGDHTLQINQTATAQKVVSANQSSQNSALGYSGTFSLGLEGDSTADITVTSSMSLLDIVDAINAQTSNTNVQASVVQVASGSYGLVLTAMKDAADITTSAVSGDDIMNALGATDASGGFANVLQAAQPAEFVLDGISLTRDTNTITDVISGITFDLLQPTPSGTRLNIDVETNTSQIASALSTLVQNYNVFRDAVVAQQATNSNGTAASSAVLFGDGTMRDIMNRLQAALNSTVGGMTMADLGLSFNEQNELQLDTGKLYTALNTNLAGVTKLLSAQTTTSSSQLSVVNTGTSPQTFTLDLTVDASGHLAGASVGGDSSMFTVNGMSIVGNAGTAYAGMAFIYSGTTSQSISVTSSLGIAAQLYKIANSTSSSAGALQVHVGSLQSRDAQLQQKIYDIQNAASAYQTQLQAQYAKYQVAIQRANSTLNYLQALFDAASNH
jgi:flagellar hook-associated protein 2